MKRYALVRLSDKNTRAELVSGSMYEERRHVEMELELANLRWPNLSKNYQIAEVNLVVPVNPSEGDEG